MSKKTVCDGATLECQLGTSTSILKVPTCHGVTTQGKNQATIIDYKPNYNIFSFCLCKRVIPPVACDPVVIMKWLKAQKDCIIDYEYVLLEDCIVPCCHGGVISIVDSGQQ